jgi:allantoicase
VSAEQRFTHVRLTIYPDGGVARLRVYGQALPDPRLLPNGMCDLAAAEWGGQVEDCSDTFFGPPTNLLLPGLSRTMGEGWETARRRDSGHDWVTVRLAAPGQIVLAELDTTHYKGNAPGWAALHGANAQPDGPEVEDGWLELLPKTALQPDTRHRFALDSNPKVTHVRLSIYPDGGMGRLRLPGHIAREDLSSLALRWFNALPEQQAEQVLAGAGPSLAVARSIASQRPLHDPDLLPQAMRGHRSWPQAGG